MSFHGGKERQGIQDVSREGFFRIADGAHPTCTCQGGREISQTHLRGSVERSESRGCISHACKRRTWTQGRRHGRLGPLQLDQPWSRAHGFNGEVKICVWDKNKPSIRRKVWIITSIENKAPVLHSKDIPHHPMQHSNHCRRRSARVRGRDAVSPSTM